MSSSIRTIFIIACQLKEKHWPSKPVPVSSDMDEETKKDTYAAHDAYRTALMPYYLVCIGRMEVEAKIKKLQAAGLVNYSVNVLTVSSYAVPD